MAGAKKKEKKRKKRKKSPSWPYWREKRNDLGILKTGRSLSCREQSAELVIHTQLPPFPPNPRFTPKGDGGGGVRGSGMERSGVQVCRLGEHLPPPECLSPP